ncbi:helix-turn-helix domain-containing protein [Peribacillus deserti]|nr:transcriptional regulator [Peribacillus deserti]
MEYSMYSPNEFGLWLKEERLKRGISTRTLGTTIGKSASYVSQLETGYIKAPSEEAAVLLLDEMGIKEKQNVLQHFEIIPSNKDFFSNKPLYQREAIKRKRTQLLDSIEKLPETQIELIHTLYFNHRDLLQALYEISNFGAEKGSKIPITVIKEFVDVMLLKYQLEQQKQLEERASGN